MRFFRKSWKYQVTTVIKYLFLILVAIVSLYPFIWVLISSFKDNNSIFGDPFGLPVKIAFENYKEVWAGADVGRNFLNSIDCLPYYTGNFDHYYIYGLLYSYQGMEKYIPFHIFFLLGNL